MPSILHALQSIKRSGAWKTRPPVAKRFLFAFLAMLAWTMQTSICTAQSKINLTDITGRKVELAAPAKRIAVAESAYYLAISLIAEDAADLVVGVGSKQSGSAYGFAGELRDKPQFGLIWSSSFSGEQIIALKPDLVVTGPSPDRSRMRPVEEILARAGIPIIYVDFFENPSENTAKSIEIIGHAIGQEQKSAEVSSFHRKHVKFISDRLELASQPRKTLGFFIYQADQICCTSLSHVNMSTYFNILRVENIADGKVPGAVGQISIEYVMERNPDVFILATSGIGPQPVFGKRSSSVNGLTFLSSFAATPGLRELAATRAHRVHAIDYSLTYSPVNVVALEVFAKWIHPELFSDLDPMATLDEINRRFLKTPLNGPFWESLDQAADQLGGKRP